MLDPTLREKITNFRVESTEKSEGRKQCYMGRCGGVMAGARLKGTFEIDYGRSQYMYIRAVERER